MISINLNGLRFNCSGIIFCLFNLLTLSSSQIVFISNLPVTASEFIAFLFFLSILLDDNLCKYTCIEYTAYYCFCYRICVCLNILYTKYVSHDYDHIVKILPIQKYHRYHKISLMHSNSIKRYNAFLVQVDFFRNLFHCTKGESTTKKKGFCEMTSTF